MPSPSIYIAELSALAAAIAALPASDAASASRYTAPRRREQSLGGRALLRLALRKRMRADPEIVVRDDRPHVAGSPQLALSLSHTGALVACVLCDSSCGIDIQHKVDKPLVDIAREFFTPAEHAELVALEGATRADRFYAQWTLKEAWAKASGFDLLPALARVRAALAGETASNEWQAWSFVPAAQVAGALVVQGHAGEPAAYVWRGDEFERADFACERVTLAVTRA